MSLLVNIHIEIIYNRRNHRMGGENIHNKERSFVLGLHGKPGGLFKRERDGYLIKLGWQF